MMVMEANERRIEISKGKKRKLGLEKGRRKETSEKNESGSFL